LFKLHIFFIILNVSLLNNFKKHDTVLHFAGEFLAKPLVPNNWNAAWFFVKSPIGWWVWQPARLHNTGHNAKAGSSIDVLQHF
jgi:hypothetical protein